MAKRLPDRSFLGPGLRSAWFLFRQPWMVAPALLGTLAWGLLFLFGLRRPGPIPTETVATLAALTPVLGAGVAAVTGLPAFMLARLLRGRVEHEPERDDELLHRCKANHFLGDESRGGSLRIGTRALTFVPHRFNVQFAVLTIPIPEIRSVGWAAIVNAAGLRVSSVVDLVTATRTETILVRQAEEIASLVETLRDAPESERASAGRAAMAAQGLSSG